MTDSLGCYIHQLLQCFSMLQQCSLEWGDAKTFKHMSVFFFLVFVQNRDFQDADFGIGVLVCVCRSGSRTLEGGYSIYGGSHHLQEVAGTRNENPVWRVGGRLTIRGMCRGAPPELG
jgi:hypothetical protein